MPERKRHAITFSKQRMHPAQIHCTHSCDVFQHLLA